MRACPFEGFENHHPASLAELSDMMFGAMRPRKAGSITDSRGEMIVSKQGIDQRRRADRSVA